MSFKTIGITGSTGVLGSYIKNNFGNVKFDCFNGDITKKKDIHARDRTEDFPRVRRTR